MKLPIKVSNELDFFKKVLMVLSDTRPISLLRPRERELLAHLLYYNNKYKDRDLEERIKLVFHKSTRIDICEAMNIDGQTFYNNKSQLKNKGILSNGYLSKFFINLYYKNNFEISFILTDGRD